MPFQMDIFSESERDAARTHEMEFHLPLGLLRGHEYGFPQMYYESRSIFQVRIEFRQL